MQIACLVREWLKQLENLDKSLFMMINQFHHPIGDSIVYWITHDKFWFPLYGIIVVYILKRLKQKAWIVLLSIVLLVLVCDQFSSSIVKPLVGRLRPCLSPNCSTAVHVVGQYHGIYGFISSHAANTFGWVTFLCLVLNPPLYLKILGFIWASLVSYGRVYGGVHYPADIVLGAMSGVLWAQLLYKFCRKHPAFPS